MQHLGGICCGSVIESLKIRFKQELHIRCPHFNLADLDFGISSERHVKHSILGSKLIQSQTIARFHTHNLSGSRCCGGGGPKMVPRRLGRLPFAFVLAIVGGLGEAATVLLLSRLGLVSAVRFVDALLQNHQISFIELIQPGKIVPFSGRSTSYHRLSPMVSSTPPWRIHTVPRIISVLSRFHGAAFFPARRPRTPFRNVYYPSLSPCWFGFDRSGLCSGVLL